MYVRKHKAFKLEFFYVQSRVASLKSRIIALIAYFTVLIMFFLFIFSGCEYDGLRYEKGNCGVSIMRSGKYIYLNTFNTPISHYMLDVDKKNRHELNFDVAINIQT